MEHFLISEATRVWEREDLLVDEGPFNRPNGDSAWLEAHKDVSLINEDESVGWDSERVDALCLIADHIVNLERLALQLHEYIFIELLNELNVSHPPSGSVADLKQVFSCVDVNNSHRESVVSNWLKQNKHYSIAKLIKKN